MDPGTWGRRKKNISVNGARIPQSLGKMKTRSKLVLKNLPSLALLFSERNLYSSGQGTDATLIKNEIAISDLRITLKALCGVETAGMNRSTSSARP